MLRRTRAETTVLRRMAAVLLALGAALAYAAASVLQQREAEADTGSDRGGAVGGGVRLVLRLARRPIWLAGLAADGVGYGFQALALGVGELLVVQPVLTSGILFALPAGAWWAGRRLGRADFAWACVLAVGLTAFLLLAGHRRRPRLRLHRRLAGVRAPIATPVLVGGHGRRHPVAGHAAGGAVRVRHRCALRHHRRAHQGVGRAHRPPRVRHARPLGAVRARGARRARVRREPARVPGRFADRVVADAHRRRADRRRAHRRHDAARDGADRRRRSSGSRSRCRWWRWSSPRSCCRGRRRVTT